MCYADTRVLGTDRIRSLMKTGVTRRESVQLTTRQTRRLSEYGKLSSVSRAWILLDVTGFRVTVDEV